MIKGACLLVKGNAPDVTFLCTEMAAFDPVSALSPYVQPCPALAGATDVAVMRLKFGVV